MKLVRSTPKQEAVAATLVEPTPEIIYNVLGKQLNISVSAANTWDDCQLKWLFDYYYKMPRVEKESTRTGNGVHDVLETCLKTGEWKFEGKPLAPKHRYRVLAERGLKASGLTVIPGKGVQDGWKTEEWTPDGMYCGPLRFKGKVDVHRVALDVFAPEALEIWDWKTAKDPLASYNPTPTSLGYLRQPLAYGYTMGIKYGLQGIPFTARYIYMATVGNSSFPMDTDEPIPWARAEEEWAKLKGIAGGMAQLAKRAKDQEPAEFVHTVPYKTGACKKYGGCGRQTVCPFSPANRTNPAYINPTITKSIDPEKLIMSTPPGLAALAALAGVNATPAASITPVAAAPALTGGRAAVPPPPASDDAGKMVTLVQQLHGMLAGGPFAAGIPVAVLDGMSAGVGVDGKAAVSAAGLTLTGGVYVEGKTAARATSAELVPVGTPYAQAEKLAVEKGFVLADVIKDAGYVVAYGLLVTPEDMAEAEKAGPVGIGALYTKYQSANEGVAAAVETIAQVEHVAAPAPAPEPGAKLTAAQEIEVTVKWLEAQAWPAEGRDVKEVLAELKAGPLSHRERLGPSVLKKAIKAFNGEEPAVLELKDGGKMVGPTDLALHVQKDPTPTPAPTAAAPTLAAAVATPTPAATVAAQLAVAEAPEQPDMASIAAAMNAKKPGTATVTTPGAQPTTPGAQVTIYVDVYADTGHLAAQPFEQWANLYTEQVMEYARQQGLDGADTGTWQLINFGKGLGLFAMVFKACFAVGQVPSLSVDSRSPLAATFLAEARVSGTCLIIRGK